MRAGLLVLAFLAVLCAGCATRYKRSHERRRSDVNIQMANDPAPILGREILKSVNGQEVVNAFLPTTGDYGTSETFLSPWGITIGNAEVVHLIFRDGRVVGLQK